MCDIFCIDIIVANPLSAKRRTTVNGGNRSLKAINASRHDRPALGTGEGLAVQNHRKHFVLVYHVNVSQIYCRTC